MRLSLVQVVEPLLVSTSYACLNDGSFINIQVRGHQNSEDIVHCLTPSTTTRRQWNISLIYSTG